MTMDRWKDRLSEYLDGQLSEREQAELEWHLQSCLECRRTLGELREVNARARTLADVEPSTDLWPAIAARLATSAQIDLTSLKVIDLRQRTQTKSARRLTLSLPQLAAASIVLMLFSGGIVWLAMGRVSGSPPSLTVAPSPVTAVSSRSAEPTDYTTAVESLETALRQQRDRLDPVTVAILEENLRAINAAITEARVALERDPSSLYLNQHLENTMKKKIQLLRRATALRGT